MANKPDPVASPTETRCAECGHGEESHRPLTGCFYGHGTKAFCRCKAFRAPRAVSPAPGGEAPTTVGTMIVRLALEERPDVDTPMWCQAVATIGHRGDYRRQTMLLAWALGKSEAFDRAIARADSDAMRAVGRGEKRPSGDSAP